MGTIAGPAVFLAWSLILSGPTPSNGAVAVKLLVIDQGEVQCIVGSMEGRGPALTGTLF